MTMSSVGRIRSAIRTAIWRSRAALAAALVLVAGPASAVEMVHSQAVEATGPKNELLFLAGKSIHISVTSSHDVFAAGNTIQVSKTSADHIISAGETLGFSEADLRDVIAAGKTLTFLTGQTHDDAVVFGETINFGSGFRVNGSAVAMGRTVVIQSPVGGSVFAAGQDVTIDSVIGGDVKVKGRHVRIGPNARIAGGLAYRAGQIDISPQAVITGPKTVLARHVDAAGRHHRSRTLTERISDALFGIVAFAVMSAGLALLLPGLIGRAGELMGRNPLKSGLWGIGALVLGPAVALVLLLTVIGVALSGALIIVLSAFLVLGMAAAAAGIGLLARRLIGRGKSADLKLAPLLGWSFIGAVILCGLGWIPIVGGWIWFVASLLGVGAVTAEARGDAGARV